MKISKVGAILRSFFCMVLLAKVGVLNKDSTVWLDGARPANIALFPAVNFTNILSAAFVPKSFCQKITNTYCKHIKAAEKTFV